ncbi:hypothetical protein [Tardibacter chloracetimidivorans]|uniref:hypothetical protein n=1 Tax=Tardibacter chloracetimidivorans TaxID=1921510 RepID=UPI001D036FBB|nr:hypothetical protein [Tardibacter chloracetimidivorans]
MAHAIRASQTDLKIKFHAVDPHTSLTRQKGFKVDDFYAARSRTIPPLPWSNIAPPFSILRSGQRSAISRSIIAHAKSLQKLAELEAENVWRPIEEYQSDHPGPYQPHIFCAHDEKRWIRMGRYDVTLKRWYYSGTNERSQWAQVEGDAPTHFRPLPSPPKGPDA